MNGPAEHDWRESCDRYGPLVAEIDGKPGDVWQVWTFGQEIDRAEYLYRRDTGDWARTYAPHAPEANPRQAIDLNAIAPLF